MSKITIQRTGHTTIKLIDPDDNTSTLELNIIEGLRMLFGKTGIRSFKAIVITLKVATLGYLESLEVDI